LRKGRLDKGAGLRASACTVMRPPARSPFCCAPSRALKALLVGFLLLASTILQPSSNGALPLTLATAHASTGAECFDEAFYLKRYPDVAAAVQAGQLPSGKTHFEIFGRKEGRLSCPPASAHRPSVWARALETLQAISLGARTAVLVLALAALLFWSRRRNWTPLRTSVALATCIAAFAYYDYLVANRVFIFLDIASDTGVQFWPMMSFLSRRIWSGELPMWSFEIGLGQNMFPSWLADPFTAVGILTGEAALPYTLAPLQVLKILAAVACTAGYFQLRGYSRTACIIGALSVGFCGHMVSRGSWYEYGTEVAVASFYLFAMERFAQTGRFVLLALATCLIGCAGTYYAYHYFVLLTTVVLVRLFWFGDRLHAPPRAVFWRWAAASTAGVLMVGVFLLPDLLTTLGSTRVSGDGGLMSDNLRTPVFTVESAQVLLTAVARQLSPNLLGGANKYTGYWNYLEAPLAWVGLLPLLCVIPCFVEGTKRLRIVLAVFLAVVVAYHSLVYFRLIIDAFAAPLFKISNLWIAIGLALCAAKVLDLVERRGEAARISVGASLVLVFAAMALVDLKGPSHEMTVDRQLLWLCAGVVLLQAASLLLVGWRKWAELPLLAILTIVFVDLTVASYQSVSVYRGALEGASPQKYAGYEDAAAKTIRKIRSADASVFRIERDKNSVNKMDALMQDYRGTKAYLSFNNPSHVQFLWDLGLLEKTPAAASYIDGIGVRGAVLPLLGVKYYLSASSTAPLGYARQFHDDKLDVFVNPNTSFGFFYTQAISRNEFSRLGGPAEKQVALLRAAVLDEPSGLARTLRADELRPQADAALSGCDNAESCLVPARVHDELVELAATPVRFEKFEENEIRGRVSARAAGVLFLSIPFDKGWRLAVDGRDQKLQHVNIGFLGAELPAGEHEFVLRYRTPGLLPGAVGTLAAVLALAGWSLWPAWRRRRATGA
jgi:hypothetical protein